MLVWRPKFQKQKKNMVPSWCTFSGLSLDQKWPKMVCGEKERGRKGEGVQGRRREREKERKGEGEKGRRRTRGDRENENEKDGTSEYVKREKQKGKRDKEGDRDGNNNADQRRTTNRPTDTANQRDGDPKESKFRQGHPPCDSFELPISRLTERTQTCGSIGTHQEQAPGYPYMLPFGHRATITPLMRRITRRTQEFGCILALNVCRAPLRALPTVRETQGLGAR